MPHSTSLLKAAAALGCAAASLAWPLASQADCVARSGAKTVALVELYTSEGCSSCPPADKQLTTLRATLGADAEAIALALHVGYWDYIGWKDPFAQKSFAERQNWLVHTSQNRVVYTPQFFVNGSEMRSWHTGLRSEVQRVNKQAPLADIQLQAKLDGRGGLGIQAQASTREPVTGAVLYLALTESGLVSKVTRGENGGVTLAHDHVVREWLGPFSLDATGARVQPRIVLQNQWNPARLNLVAFVQDQRSGQVLQALSAAQCAGT